MACEGQLRCASPSAPGERVKTEVCAHRHGDVHAHAPRACGGCGWVMAAGGWCKGGPGSRLQHRHQLELGSISVDLGQLDDRRPLKRSREDTLVILHAEAHRGESYLGGDGALQWAVSDWVSHGTASAPEVKQTAAGSVPDDDKPKPVSPLSQRPGAG